MKRIFIVASLAIMAVGCQKTEIQNEVQNQIGFSTETGKMTRAIVQNGEDGIAEYPTTQPFGVYAYGYQMETVTVNEVEVTRRKEGTISSPMVNVEISYDDNDTESVVTDDAWRATGTVRYYWPNDPRTRLDFYAYSPAQPGEGAPTTANLAPHQKLTGTISHSETDGLKLTDYVHSNMYVDFMVSDPVVGATYSVPVTGATPGEVPLNFNHEMTQINFTVKLDATSATDNKYPNIDFKIKSIVLNNIVSQATYEYNSTAVVSPATVPLKWTPKSEVVQSYQIYPVISTANAPAVVNGASTTSTTEETVVLRTDPAGTRNEAALAEGVANPGFKFSTTPVTMIPQVWDSTTPQSFTVIYEISGTGVATEEIVKTFNFNITDAPAWERNKKITYTLTIGLNEITFAPSVTNWSEADDSFTDDPSNV